MPIADQDRLPLLFLPQTDRDIPNAVVCFRSVGGIPQALRRMLTETERSALEHRGAELRSAVEPAPKSSRDALIDVLLAILPLEYDEETSMGLAAQYLETVAGQPEWAIKITCMTIRRQRSKLIKPGQTVEELLNELVNAAVTPYRRQLVEIDAILSAKVKP